MRLFEIETEILKAISLMVDHETGEINEDADAILEGLQDTKASKVLNTVKYIKTLEAESAAMKNAEESIAKRRKVIENKSKSLRSYLKRYAEGEKYEDSEAKISWRKSKSTFADIGLIPEEFKLTKVSVSADKSAIKKALESGVSIAGAHIFESLNIQIK